MRRTTFNTEQSGWLIEPSRVAKHTELCAFVCKDQQAKETLINFQIFKDLELIKVCVEVDDLRMRATLDMSANIDQDDWLTYAESIYSEGLWADSKLDLLEPLLKCLRVMMNPINEIIIQEGEKHTYTAEEKPKETAERFWLYEEKDKTPTQVTVECRPQGRAEDAIVANYEIKIKPQEALITLYSTYRIPNQEAITLQNLFSYKASVKMSDLTPWVNATRHNHELAIQSVGQDGKMVSGAFDKAISLIWFGIDLGLSQKHEKKVQQKDIKHDSLFDIDEV